jgi:hypothetical protein
MSSYAFVDSFAVRPKAKSQLFHPYKIGLKCTKKLN